MIQKVIKIYDCHRRLWPKPYSVSSAMTSLCIAGLVLLVAFIIWKGTRCSSCSIGRAINKGAVSQKSAPLAEQVRIAVPGTVIKPPIMGASLGPRKDIAKSDLLSDPEDNPVRGRFKYVGSGGMSCPNARWYSSVYDAGPYTEIDAPGIAAKDMMDPDLMVLGTPPDPDSVRAFIEPKSQHALLAGDMLV